jgi:uncharacterized protein YcfL
MRRLALGLLAAALVLAGCGSTQTAPAPHARRAAQAEELAAQVERDRAHVREAAGTEEEAVWLEALHEDDRALARAVSR